MSGAMRLFSICLLQTRYKIVYGKRLDWFVFLYWLADCRFYLRVFFSDIAQPCVLVPSLNQHSNGHYACGLPMRPQSWSWCRLSSSTVWGYKRAVFLRFVSVSSVGRLVSLPDPQYHFAWLQSTAGSTGSAVLKFSAPTHRCWLRKWLLMKCSIRCTWSYEYTQGLWGSTDVLHIRKWWWVFFGGRFFGFFCGCSPHRPHASQSFLSAFPTCTSLTIPHSLRFPLFVSLAVKCRWKRSSLHYISLKMRCS